MPEATTCSKCGKDLDTRGTPLWCRACRATYQREYETARMERTQAKSFVAGAEEMRRAILASLLQMNQSGLLRVYETAQWIAGVPAPRP